MALFYLSPSVNVVEKDLSATIAAVSTSITATAGLFDWGPCYKRTLISSNTSLEQTFSTPITTIIEPHWFSAYNNLLYNEALYVTRVVDETQAKNGGFEIISDTELSDKILKLYFTPTGINLGASAVLTQQVQNAEEATVTVSLNIISIETDGVLCEFTNKDDINNSLITIDNPFSYTTDVIVTFTASKLANATSINYQHLQLTIPSETDVVISKGEVVIQNGLTAVIQQVSRNVKNNVVTYDCLVYANFDSTFFNSAATVEIDRAGNITQYTIISIESIVSGNIPITDVSNILIKNLEDFDIVLPTTETANSRALVYSKYPSDVYSAQIRVSIANAADFATTDIIPGVSFASEFEFAPTENEFALVVTLYNESTKQYSIAEKFTVSTNPLSKDYTGTLNYFESVIKNQSAYIYMKDTDVDNFTTPLSSCSNVSLNGYMSGNQSYDEVEEEYIPIDVGYILEGYDTFANAEEVDINIIIDGGWPSRSKSDVVTIHQHLNNISDSRKDCISVLSAPRELIVNIPSIAQKVQNLIYYRQKDLNLNSSYTAFYGNYKQQFNSYTNTNIWVPISADVAGCYAFTDSNSEPWMAPAGLSRGQLKNVVSLALNADRTYRDQLYKAQVNIIQSFPGEGTVVWGQKTMLSQPSSFDRVDIRRLFIILEKSISTSARQFIFEKNTSFTRNRFLSILNPYLTNIQSRGGLDEFLVVCDTSNNTADVLARNEFVADIYLKPTKTAEFIRLSFINVGDSVSFTEAIASQ